MTLIKHEAIVIYRRHFAVRVYFLVLGFVLVYAAEVNFSECVWYLINQAKDLYGS